MWFSMKLSICEWYRSSKDGQDQLSRPDLVLSGHEENAPFALEVSTTDDPLVLSGGEDKKVLLWNIEDFSSTTATTCNQFIR